MGNEPWWKAMGICCVFFLVHSAVGQPREAQLAPDVNAVWDLSKAWRETTATRDQVCINGIWRWQPARGNAERVPSENWGYFKVPGPWPIAEDGAQRLYAHPSWRAAFSTTDAAWYQRDIQVPKSWAGRRIAVYAEYVNSIATVYIDGKRMGGINYPAGEVDVTAACRPGGKHLLAMRVVALPLQRVLMSYGNTDEAKLVKGAVSRRGLTGDVFLMSTPAGPRIHDLKIDSSVRNWQIMFGIALEIQPGAAYRLRARILDNGKQVKLLETNPFTTVDLREGRYPFTARWKPEKLWDLHTPQNMYTAELSLLDSRGEPLDTYWPVRFGFREFEIRGRDFYLNGTRIFCSVVPFESANGGVYEATYEAARETLLFYKKMGINTLFTHYYKVAPGSNSALEDILRAADDVGMLISLSQPHFADYDWDAPNGGGAKSYARHAAFYVRMAQNHPSVVMYSTSHNATAYPEDMNPDQIGDATGNRNPATSKRADNALKAEAVLKSLDRTRVIYHHSSGNLSQMYTSNFYLNFVPVQERSDWFEHWSRNGLKPAFLVEYGPPLPPSWTMYRGWYKGQRAFLEAIVPWELCTAEWGSQFRGDAAFDLEDKEKANLRFEAAQGRAGKPSSRSEYPHPFNSSGFDVRNRVDVQAIYLKDNLRAFRTWELSGTSGWSYDRFYVIPDGAGQPDQRPKVDWNTLQKPGYSIDLVRGGPRMRDWVLNAAGHAYVDNNQPLLAYIGGKASRFTSKDHNFLAGQTVEKQIIIINNSRETVNCESTWSVNLPQAAGGSRQLTVETGQIARLAVKAALPPGVKPGKYQLAAMVRFSSGETQKDTFEIDVLPPPPRVNAAGRIALFDPKGETARVLEALGVRTSPVDANSTLSGYDILIVGKGALTLEGAAPDIGSVAVGLKVIMFEQTADVLEKRFGFRVQEYGLRQVFARVPDHPLLEGLQNQHLHDWQGKATIYPPRLQYEMRPQHGPSIVRSGIQVTRPWRAGNWGNVASVLIEKPAIGDFLPITDGGFSLQYSPLMVYREGKGLMLFCQMDVTGRSASDPAATRLVANILNYAARYTPAASHTVRYAGELAGRRHLESAGMRVDDSSNGRLTPSQVLVVGPGGGRQLGRNQSAIRDWLGAGGRLLAVGISQDEANSFLPFQVRTQRAEYISAVFDPFDARSLLAGVGPADVYNRDPRPIELVTGGARPAGNGVLAVGREGNVVFCQLVPWHFDYQSHYHMKRTFRRTSYLLERVLSNMGVSAATPLLERFSKPLANGREEKRWLNGFYLDAPEEFDDPYRFFRW